MIASERRGSRLVERGVRAKNLGACTLIVAAVLATSGGRAAAQIRSKDARAAVPAAQALFDEGKKLVSRGAAAEACPKFEESQRLDPAIGTQYWLADCYQRVGRTASAWSTFLEAAAAARKADEGDREQAARDRARALEPKLTRVAVHVASAVPGLEITRSGIVVGEAQWGLALPVDPGTIVVRATAPGKKPFETSVEAKGAGRTFDVRVPALEDEPKPEVAVAPAPAADAAPNPAAAPAAPPPDAAPATSPPPFEERTGRGRRIAAIGAAAAGLVGVGVGTVFGLLSMAKGSDAESHCRGDLCDATGVGLRDDAIVAGNVSTVAFAIGGVGLAAGAVLWLTAPSSSSSSTGGRAGLRVGAGNLALEGRW